MARYLMTHSLLSAWLYAMKENPYENEDSDKNPLGEFMTVLRREPTPTTKAMQDGIDFEDLVTAILCQKPAAVLHKYDSKTKELNDTQMVSTGEHPWYSPAVKTADIIRGSLIQVRARKEIQVNGLTFVLYGRLDALKAGSIYDIKFSRSYDRGKYFTSTQHPIYMEIVPEAERFTYVVSNGIDVWTESYRRDETPSIFPVISDFLDWLTACGLMKLYTEKWLAR